MWCHDTKLWNDSTQHAMVAIEWWCTIPVTHPNPGFRSVSSPEAPWPSPRTTLLTTRCFYHCHWLIWRNAFQTRKNHRGGIKKPSTRRHMSMKGKCKHFKTIWWAQLFSGCDPKFLRNLKFAKKHNLNQHQKEKKAASAWIKNSWSISCGHDIWLLAVLTSAWDWNKSLVPRPLFELGAISDVLNHILNCASGWMKRLLGRLGALATR